MAADRVWVACTLILPLRDKGAAGSAVRPVAIGMGPVAELDENKHQADDRDGPYGGTQPRYARDEHHGIGEASPEESCAPRSVVELVLFATTAISTSAAKSTRLSSILRCARAARSAQPVIGGSPSRLPASAGNPTCAVAPDTATSICAKVSATAQASQTSSGFMSS